MRLCYIQLHTQEDEDVFVYEASASGVDGSTFTAHIRVPGIYMCVATPMSELGGDLNSIYILCGFNSVVSM